MFNFFKNLLGSLLTVDLSDANGQSVSQLLCSEGYAKQRVPEGNVEENGFAIITL